MLDSLRRREGRPFTGAARQTRNQVRNKSTRARGNYVNEPKKNHDTQLLPTIYMGTFLPGERSWGVAEDFLSRMVLCTEIESKRVQSTEKWRRVNNQYLGKATVACTTSLLQQADRMQRSITLNSLGTLSMRVQKYERDKTWKQTKQRLCRP